MTRPTTQALGAKLVECSTDVLRAMFLTRKFVHRLTTDSNSTKIVYKMKIQ